MLTACAVSGAGNAAGSGGVPVLGNAAGSDGVPVLGSAAGSVVDRLHGVELGIWSLLSAMYSSNCSHLIKMSSKSSSARTHRASIIRNSAPLSPFFFSSSCCLKMARCVLSSDRAAASNDSSCSARAADVVRSMLSRSSRSSKRL